ncbi:DUF2730 family protein [Candidatus Kaiserbacteria bacterium]|nr:DUF2730 family protein [Candidatus Kaiserbacteria bacterium]
MNQDTKDILEAVNFIKGKVEKIEDKVEKIEDKVEGIEERVEKLPTRDDVRVIVEEVVDEKLRPIHAALAQINRRLDIIEEQYGNLKGVTKEIDEIRGEVRAIQKHLGIKGKIPA